LKKTPKKPPTMGGVGTSGKTGIQKKKLLKRGGEKSLPAWACGRSEDVVRGTTEKKKAKEEKDLTWGAAGSAKPKQGEELPSTTGKE